MKVVITGATGNVGTSLVEALALDPDVTEIVGLARRRPEMTFEKTRFVAADVARDELQAHMHGADAVVHLAWKIQPSHDATVLRRTNVDGSMRVFRAALMANVPTLVVASSCAAYAADPDEPGSCRRVDESWPTRGVPSSTYSRHKCEVEKALDVIERDNPRTRVVRIRSALTFKATAGSEIQRYFLGRFVPSSMFDVRRIPVVPDLPAFRFQTVHSHDVADAYRRVLRSDVRGAFNLAAEPVIDTELLAQTFGARTMKVSRRLARAVVGWTYRLRLQPTEPGWLDLGFELPIMDCTRAHRELSWQPRFSGMDAVMDLLAGMRERSGVATAPLTPAGQPG